MSFLTTSPLNNLQLPPARIVDAAGADAIAVYLAYSEALPARRSAEQLNRLDELGDEVRTAVLNSRAVAAREDEYAALVSTLSDELASVASHFRRLAELRGLEVWGANTARGFRPEDALVTVSAAREPMLLRASTALAALLATITNMKATR